MAKRQLTISIPTPCTEDWKAMTPDKNGKFCASCQKTVVDFSRMSDTEIFNYFESFQGSTCGRFSTKQLSAPIVVPLVVKPPQRWAWALSALLLPTFAASQTAKMPEPFAIVTPSVFEQKIDDSDLTIKGEVSELGTQLPLAQVQVSLMVRGKLVGRVSTDAKGMFTTALPKAFEHQAFTLVFDCPQMDKQELNFANYAAVLNTQLFVYMDKIQKVQTPIRLKGIVSDQSGESLVGVTIVVKGTTIGTQTDFDGHFDFEIPSKVVNNAPFDVVVSYLGYGTEDITIFQPVQTNNLNIQLKEHYLGDLVVVGGYSVVHYNFFQRTKFKLRNFFRRLINN